MNNKSLIGLIFATIIVLGFLAIFVLMPEREYTTSSSGCRIYNVDKVIEKDNLPEYENTGAYKISDVFECVRPAQGDELEPWEDQVLRAVRSFGSEANDLDSIVYGEYLGPVYVAKEDFSIVPLYGGNLVVWVCPEEIECTWTPDTLGHSTIMYFDDGTPIIKGLF